MQCTGEDWWEREMSVLVHLLCSSASSDSDKASEGDSELLNSVSFANTFAP